MYVIREVLHCKPGRVRPMVEKFRVLSNVLEEMGQEPLRLLTDAGGERFWTIVAEAKMERIDDFFAYEQKLMENAEIRNTMADYHDLVESGRREIYRIES
jgi:capsule polysaccharide modification protein KpsS